jgi:beta-phosphoglucomutase-like phosphatase (HAD superfamily)
MHNFKAVFWDIDGVIVISEPLHVEKINKTALKYGIQNTQDDWDKWYGIGDHRIYEALSDKGLPISEEAFIDECLDYYTENQSRLIVREGFKDAFNFCAARNLSQATVSSGVAQQVRANLDAAQIGCKMAFNLSASDVIAKGLATKPAPDPYLEALRMLNAQNGNTHITPQQCIVVEDSGSGVKAGKDAGMHAIHWRPEEDDKTSNDASSSAHDAPSLMQALRQLMPR